MLFNSFDVNQSNASKWADISKFVINKPLKQEQISLFWRMQRILPAEKRKKPLNKIDPSKIKFIDTERPLSKAGVKSVKESQRTPLP